jgi:beta-lactamase class A
MRVSGRAGRIRQPILGIAAAIILFAAAACSSSAMHEQSGPQATPPSTSSRPVTSSGPTLTTAPAHPSTTRPKPTPTSQSPAQVRAAVTAKIAALTKHEPDHSISIAALNTVTGAQYFTGASSGMWTASVYKLYVLETLLLRHQQSGAFLSDNEVSEATPMIEQSDNVAGYSLFLDDGGNSGLAAAAQTLGLTHTVPGRSDPTFTTTSAKDCLTMLKALIGKGRLDAKSRSFALGLMRQVEADQRWGVGVIADHGTDFANKNGWLSIDNSNGPGEDDGGRWVVNSVGVITVHGQQVLMAVMTEHQPDFQTGVNLVQALAKAVEPAIAG